MRRVEPSTGIRERMKRPSRCSNAIGWHDRSILIPIAYLLAFTSNPTIPRLPFRALTRLDALSKKDPSFAVELALLHRSLGNKEEALVSATRMVRIDPYRAGEPENSRRRSPSRPDSPRWPGSTSLPSFFSNPIERSTSRRLEAVTSLINAIPE